jgi:histone H3/H4/DNA-binding transcriptional ArsR family regulator
MANELVAQCWLIQFPTPPMRLVMMKLCDCADPDGTSIYPSLDTIRRETGLGRSTVCAALAAFEQSGLVEVRGQNVGNRYGKSTTLREINTEALRLIAGRRRKGLRSLPPTHILTQLEVEIPPGTSELALPGAALTSQVEPAAEPRRAKVWAILPQRQSPEGEGHKVGRPSLIVASPLGGQAKIRTLDASGSGGGTPPVQVRDSTCPGDGPNPKKRTPQWTPPSLRPALRGASKGAGEIDELILRITTLERRIPIANLIEPIARQLKIDAPDPAYALGLLADSLTEYDEQVLTDAAKIILKTRHSTVKPSDIHEALLEAKKMADHDAKLARGPLIFKSQAELWHRARTAVSQKNPIEAERLFSGDFVRRDAIARLGVML